MRRKFTVYGLRFSKTSFWNRMNTGFLDPAVATVLTACGIETDSIKNCYFVFCSLQQCLPLAVLKPSISSISAMRLKLIGVATVLTACGIETIYMMAILNLIILLGCNSAYRLRY